MAAVSGDRVTKFEQIQAARDLRLSKQQRGSWSVVKRNDDGREIVVERNVTAFVAEKLAGARRDSMPDADVGDGWTFIASRQSGKTGGFEGRDSRTEPRANEYA